MLNALSPFSYLANPLVQGSRAGMSGVRVKNTSYVDYEIINQLLKVRLSVFVIGKTHMEGKFIISIVSSYGAKSL